MTTAEHHTEPIPIVYLIDHFAMGGGTENQLAVLFSNLDRSMFTPYLFSLGPNHSLWQMNTDFDVNFLGVKKLVSFHAIKAVIGFARFLRQHRVQIIQIFTQDSNIVGALAAKLAGVPKIIIGRRDLGFWYTQKKRLALTNFINQGTDYCIANAEAVKRVVSKHESLPENRIEVIFNGTQYTEPPANSPITREFFNIPPSVPIMGIVANIKPIKRIDYFLQAFAAMKHTEAHGIILGRGTQEKEMAELAGKLGIADRIHVHHTVETAEVYATMKLFTAGLLTSQTEGLSNVLIEYAFSGIPALAFDVGGNPEVIVHGSTGFVVPPYDTEALAERMDYLIDHPDERTTLGKNAAVRARELYTVEHMVDKTQQFYVSILGRLYMGTANADGK